MVESVVDKIRKAAPDMLLPSLRIFGQRKRKGSLAAISVLGAFRCGTNYVKIPSGAQLTGGGAVQRLRLEAAGVPIFSGGSGYEYPQMPAVFVVKNPYAFALSLHKHFIENRKGMIASEAFDDILKKTDRPFRQPA